MTEESTATDLRDEAPMGQTGNALAIVSTELMATIRNAHLSLEDCVDGQGGSPALLRAAELLHQVRGALQITETYGAALLAEEMELSSRYLAALREGKGREDGLDAVTRAMVQLPSYVERILNGGRDIALVLLPILNDLRAARGEPLLSEGTLLLLNLSPSQSKKRRDSRPEDGQELVAVARRLRPKYQLALLGWIKGGDGTRPIETLASVARALENAAHRDDVYQLWWVTGGVLEALRDGGLETSVALKRLLGQTDRQIKLMIDSGPDAFDKHPVDDLLNNLLYYVARSKTSGERIGEIRAAFNLSELLPGDEQVEHAREALAAPSIKLMETVASAIKEDLGSVKDVLDIFVRTGMNKSSDLVPQLELLKKISDTLGVLGLGELRSDVEGEIDRLKLVVERGGVANEQIILDIASTLLRVEDRLDQQLIRLTMPGDVAPRVGDNMDPGEAADYRQVAESVMRECIINLARIKETVSQSLAAQAPSQGLDSVPTLIRGIKAGLLMLNKTRAMDVIDRIGALITLTLTEGAMKQLTQRETDRLADAIVSIEYYMETVKVGRAEPWYMLDNAEACLGVLRDVEARLKASRPEKPAPPPAPAPPPPTPSIRKFAVVSESGVKLDPELLELFIEEAKEEIASIRKHLPAWAKAPDDMETLITVRRSFHTLKGSGRMVGAERIGEYCWSIENLLNRLINRTLIRTPPMIEFILKAAAAVPELIEQLEVGASPKSDITLLMARAHAFAEGDPNAAVLEVESSDVPEEEPAGLEMDPVLLDIFSKETAGHLAVIRAYVEACKDQRPPYEVTDKLHRACHTLHGSANMANVERGVAVAGALNRYVRRLYDHESGFDAKGFGLLSRAADAIEAIVKDINKPHRERADYSELIEQLVAISQAASMDTTRAPLTQPPPANEPGPAESERPAEAAEADYDAEIASIFAEESAELLESVDSAFEAWRSNKRAEPPVDALKRDLHTLKGGARTAGITAMGNLSHEIETLFLSVCRGAIEATPAVEELLQSSIDELHRMRDLVIASKPVVAATDIERRIQQANAGELPERETKPRPADVETASSVDFSPEPDDTVSMVILDSPLDEEQAAIGFVDDDASGQDPSHAESWPVTGEEAEATPAEIPAAKTPEEEPVKEPTPEPDPVEEPEPEPEPVEPPPEKPPEKSPPPPEDEPEPIKPPSKKPPAELRQMRAREQRQEVARVDADLLENLLNAAGEISIFHSRLNQQVSNIEFHVEEFEQTVQRLREQLRKLEIETEAQIIAGHQETMVAKDFDPLELDRYSNIQQLSRALAESANDLESLKDLLAGVTREAEGLLVQQSRVTAELQDGLMRTRMVPFERHVSRLTRLVRQAASETGKRAELAVEGASGELDRQVLDKMLPPFEHMLRNAVIHGIEPPDVRLANDKPAVGRITIRLHREGAEMVIDVADDGAGLNVDAIRRKAYELDMLKPDDSEVSDEEIMQLILTPGFTTATRVTQSAGRGVGMDVVANEIKKLGGSLRISSVTGQGTNFTVRLPFTLAITQALIVRTGEEVYALPLPSVEGVARIPRSELENLLSQSEPSYQYGEQTYRFRHLGMYLGGKAAQLPDDESFIPVILVRAGEYSAALLTDEMIASQEIVVKSVGPQLASIRGIAGATILGDGRIVLILDINALVRSGAPVVELKSAAPAPADDRPLAMVVDDSITVRRVTERFLQRHGMRVVTAKDGLDAISVLSDHRPDVILLDIEMPRMDGYEFASHVRNDERVADVPIIMITSRVGDKHRARAIELGVNDYLGKPYQDAQLLEAIERQLEDRGISLS